MSQFNAEVNELDSIVQSEEYIPERPKMLDYDEEPYGDDNLLVKASKRRSFLFMSKL